MRLAYMRIEHLPVKAERARDPRLHGVPVVIGGTTGTRRVVLDASAEALGVAALGSPGCALRAGMPLAEALATCRGAVVVEPDPAHYARAFEDVLRAIEALGADVEEVELGTAYVRLDNLTLLFGGEEHLTKALLAAVPAHFAPRMGIGPVKFLASVSPGGSGAALRAQRATGDGPAMAPAGAAGYLRALPVDVLPVAWELKERLRAFGLHTLGDVARLPVGPLQAQFGRHGRLVWELTHGIDRRPFLPRSHEEVVEAAMAFPTPTASTGALVTAVDGLLRRTFAQPGMRGRFARVCTLHASLHQAGPRAPDWQRRMAFREPVGERAKALALIKHTLEGRPPPGPLESLRITLSGLTGEAGRQESLFSDVRRQENLNEALRQLQARLGKQPPVYHIREVEPWSRLPERRRALVPVV